MYLKTDTQGHDPAVLWGALAPFNNIVGLQAEVPAVLIYEGMQSMPETISSLNDMGYVPYGFHEINKPERLGGIMTEYDVVFVRKPGLYISVLMRVRRRNRFKVWFGNPPEFKQRGVDGYTRLNAVSWRVDPVPRKEINTRHAEHGFNQHSMGVCIRAHQTFSMFEELF